MTTNTSLPRKRGPGNNKRDPDKLDRTLRAGYTFTLGANDTKDLVIVRIIRPNGQPFTDVFTRLVDEGALDCLDRATQITEQLRIQEAEHNRRRRSPGANDPGK
jgi:hypothetical protein